MGREGDLPPSIGALWALVDRVAPREVQAWEGRAVLRRGRRVSASRALQLRAAVRTLERAVAREEMPEGAGGDLGVLLSPEGVDVVLELARDGHLRDPELKPLRGRKLSDASLGSLRDCLKILGEEAGVEVLLPQVWRPQPKHLSRPMTARQAAALYRRLADMAAAAPLEPGPARTLACVGVILDTGMRQGDMLARRVGDVDVGAGTIRVSHHAQNAAHRGPVEGVARLREGTVVALKRWLAHRAELVGRLEGSDPGALWVSVRARGQKVPDAEEWRLYPAGEPLGPRGYVLGFQSGVDRLNTLLAGSWEGPGRWRPLPRRPEQLRRAVEAEVEQVEGAGDSSG